MSITRQKILLLTLSLIKINKIRKYLHQLILDDRGNHILNERPLLFDELMP